MNTITQNIPAENPILQTGSFGDSNVDSLRDGDTEAFAKGSVFAACLLPILTALGREGINRELLESMPHFAGKLDLTDLRNILVSQGYVSDAQTRRINAIPAELYPVLFTAPGEDPKVLTERNGEYIEYYDTGTRSYRSELAKSMDNPGTAYVFTDKSPSHGVKQNQTANAWFSTMLSRFRGMIWQLLMITGVVNITALCVPLFIMMIYDKVIGARSLDSLPMILTGVGILMLSDLILRYQKAKAMGAIAGRMDYLIGVETFKHLLLLPRCLPSAQPSQHSWQG